MPVVRKVGLIVFARRLWQQVVEDNVLVWASALAYSWLFAIFPFLIFLLALVPQLPRQWKSNLYEETGATLQKALPETAYKTVWDGFLDKRLKSYLDNPPGGFLSLGLLLAIWGASGGMAMTMNALDRCYDIEKSKPYWKQRPIAIVLTIVCASLILAVVILLPVATVVRNTIVNHAQKIFPPQVARTLASRPLLIFFDITRYAIALAFMFLALATLYHFGPSVRQRFRWITPGSLFCVIVWVVLGALFRFYVNKYGRYDQTYGPVGGVVILLLFFYIDAVVLLIGAEINSEIDFISLGLSPGAMDFTGEPWK
jgi:membrane protein